jgi:hypothetical protein
MTNRLAPPKLKVIVNWDGDDALCQTEYPMSAKTFDKIVLDDMREAGVDCVFWNGSAGSTAFYPSEVLDFKGDVTKGKCGGDFGHTSVQQWRSIANAKAMIERGEDCNQILIEGARRRGLTLFYSCRMNDQHRDPTDMTRIKLDHPEWLLGDSVPEWFSTSWDYSHAEVREHRLAMVKELADNYDFDGIELDWQRHAHHLPVHQAFRRRYVMTDFMRLARQITDEASKRRGRPFWLAARVAASKEGCLKVGYDVEKWVEEGLVDYLIPSACGEMDSSLDGAWWVELCRETPIRIYPSLGGWFFNETHGAQEVDTYFTRATRALGLRLYDEGVDGFYTFNWYARKRSRRDILQQLADPESMRMATKTYITTVRPYRAPGSGFAGIGDQDRIYGEVPVELHPTQTGAGATVTWKISDDAPAAGDRLQGITLRLHVRDWSPLDELAVAYDGKLLGEPTVRFSAAENDAITSQVDPVAWLEYGLDAHAGSRGAHTVEISLQKRNPDLSSALVLLDVDLEIIYKDSDIG